MFVPAVILSRWLAAYPTSQRRTKQHQAALRVMHDVHLLDAQEPLADDQRPDGVVRDAAAGIQDDVRVACSAQAVLRLSGEFRPTRCYTPCAMSNACHMSDGQSIPMARFSAAAMLILASMQVMTACHNTKALGGVGTALTRV